MRNKGKHNPFFRAPLCTYNWKTSRMRNRRDIFRNLGQITDESNAMLRRGVDAFNFQGGESSGGCLPLGAFV